MRPGTTLSRLYTYFTGPNMVLITRYVWYCWRTLKTPLTEWAGPIWQRCFRDWVSVHEWWAGFWLFIKALVPVSKSMVCSLTILPFTMGPDKAALYPPQICKLSANVDDLPFYFSRTLISPPVLMSELCTFGLMSNFKIITSLNSCPSMSLPLWLTFYNHMFVLCDERALCHT